MTEELKDENGNPIEQADHDTGNTSIDAFLKQNVDSGEEEQEIKLGRFPVPFKARALRSDEIDTLRSNATITRFNPRTHNKEREVNQSKLSDLMVVESITYPDLSNEQLQQSWNGMGDKVQTLKNMLLLREYNHLSSVINDMNSENPEDEKDEVKN